jgi:nucleoside-diphosphate-sugar epimerase
MAVMVTGALGFVGINVCARLASDGDRVVAVARNDPDENAVRFLAPAREAVTFRRCDIRDSHTLSDIFSKDGVESVIHGAVITANRPEDERLLLSEATSVNVGGTATLLEVAARKGVQDFIYISSASVYGYAHGAKRKLTEKTPPKPTGLYAITKLASELICARVAQVCGMRLVILRIAQPYGPMERRTGGRALVSAIYDWIAAAIRAEEVAVPDGKPYRDYTYITDITDGIVRASRSDQEGVFNLSLGKSYSLEDILREIRNCFPEFRFRLGEGQLRLDMNPQNVRPPLDCSRTRREFGFRPTVNLPEGIAKYAEWVRSFGVP